MTDNQKDMKKYTALFSLYTVPGKVQASFQRMTSGCQGQEWGRGPPANGHRGCWSDGNDPYLEYSSGCMITWQNL